MISQRLSSCLSIDFFMGGEPNQLIVIIVAGGYISMGLSAFSAAVENHHALFFC